MKCHPSHDRIDFCPPSFIPAPTVSGFKQKESWAPSNSVTHDWLWLLHSNCEENGGGTLILALDKLNFGDLLMAFRLDGKISQVSFPVELGYNWSSGHFAMR